ncbi:MAG: ABC transporter ATP-binding protein [Acidimicrobiales bacterium]
MTPMSANLEVAGVCKRFGQNPVLMGVNLSVPAGSFTAILGPSGSGKTTLLRIIAGFDRADEGTVMIGSDVLDGPDTYVPPERRHVGYVSQNGSLFPHLSVEENVTFGLPRNHRRSHDVDDLFDAIDLGPLAHRYPHQLSGGQQQRVALARALAVNPRFILLDEPFASLDASARSDVRSDVRKILKRVGTTAVLVTHDQDEALSMADQVAVIRDARIVQSTTPLDLYERPVDTGVAQFVGDANLVDGRLKDGLVVTDLGSLTVMGNTRATDGDVTVLIRPEQFALSRTSGESAVGVAILDSDFHGHDSVYRVSFRSPAFEHVLTVRLQSSERFAAGDTAHLRVVGPVTAWSST